MAPVERESLGIILAINYLRRARGSRVRALEPEKVIWGGGGRVETKEAEFC